MAKTKPTQSQAAVIIRAMAGRTVNTFALKTLIRDTGAVLARKGRSSTWLLFADTAQMRQIVTDIQQSDQPSWQWLAKLVGEKCNHYSYQELLNLVNRNPAITVNQLIAMTDCTIADARKVIDDAMDL